MGPEGLELTTQLRFRSRRCYESGMTLRVKRSISQRSVLVKRFWKEMLCYSYVLCQCSRSQTRMSRFSFRRRKRVHFVKLGVGESELLSAELSEQQLTSEASSWPVVTMWHWFGLMSVVLSPHICFSFTWRIWQIQKPAGVAARCWKLRRCHLAVCQDVRKDSLKGVQQQHQAKQIQTWHYDLSFNLSNK